MNTGEESIAPEEDGMAVKFDTGEFNWGQVWGEKAEYQVFLELILLMIEETRLLPLLIRVRHHK